MADELKNSLGTGSKLIAGSGGVFEVTVDGTPVFSKKQSGRFPEPGEITGLLKQRKS